MINNKDKISSCIIEPIQCTAGDIYLDPQTLRDIQKICKMNDICFIVDEVQTGFGVTGSYWYSEIINLSGLKSGIYILKLISSEAITLEKIVKR